MIEYRCQSVDHHLKVDATPKWTLHFTQLPPAVAFAQHHLHLPSDEIGKASRRSIIRDHKAKWPHQNERLSSKLETASSGTRGAKPSFGALPNPGEDARATGSVINAAGL